MKNTCRTGILSKPYTLRAHSKPLKRHGIPSRNRNLGALSWLPVTLVSLETLDRPTTGIENENISKSYEKVEKSNWAWFIVPVNVCLTFLITSIFISCCLLCNQVPLRMLASSRRVSEDHSQCWFLQKIRDKCRNLRLKAWSAF